jgi:SAM-dependent methyltransferase
MEGDSDNMPGHNQEQTPKETGANSGQTTPNAPRNLKGIRELYDQGTNIMRYFRELEGTSLNSSEAIQISYDLQSGCTSGEVADPEYVARYDAYTSAIARTLSQYGGTSLLEAGVGEAKTLCDVMTKMPVSPPHIYGFDLAWSRIATGLEYAARHDGFHPSLSMGDLLAMPFADNTFDVVFTAQAVNPNHGREEEAMRELYRVTRRWLLLFELDYELGGEETKRRIEEHGYCRDLVGTAKRLGYKVVEHRLLGADVRPSIQVSVLVIEKPGADGSTAPSYGCPRCHQSLVSHRGNYFCADCLVVYPVLNGIPCLLPGSGILATKYLEFR